MMLYRDELKIPNILPPLFINIVIAVIWAIYVGLHLIPLLQIDVPLEHQDLGDARKGTYHMIISQTLVLMLLVCYARAFLTNPGSVPDTPEWKMGFRTHTVLNLPQTFEVKESGERRHCKWCLKYKPDRCHHCRICKTCVLKMDHHCPWIMNCVGFRNHKYFFLLVIYAVLSCIFIAVTMSETVHYSTITETPADNRFFLVLGLLLAILMGTLMGIFLCFHIWLMLNAMTTIEFCEKNTRSMASTPGKSGASYDAGFVNNWKSVFGPEPLLWLLPLSPPLGDGIDHYYTSEPKHHVDPEWTGPNSDS